MIIYNITFHIDKEVLDKTLIYLKKTYIPDSMSSGFLQRPCLRKVMHTIEGEGHSYAVQFHVKNVDTLNYWMKNEGLEIHASLTQRFGDKVTGFTTLLEEIDWEE